MKYLKTFEDYEEDDFDNIDAKESDYLIAKPSQIKNAGMGLYTSIDIYKGEIIAYYIGENLSDEEAKKRSDNNEDQYFVVMLDGSILDAKNSDCFGRYANDAEGIPGSGFKNNAKISLDDNDDVCLVATRDIKSGEEIFIPYGRKYWKKQLG
jgi:hypothetical protein